MEQPNTPPVDPSLLQAAQLADEDDGTSLRRTATWVGSIVAAVAVVVVAASHMWRIVDPMAALLGVFAFLVGVSLFVASVMAVAAWRAKFDHANSTNQDLPDWRDSPEFKIGVFLAVIAVAFVFLFGYALGAGSV